MDQEQLELKLSLLDEWQSACTHCGICSESCITFQATGWEHNSPRGRIRLARDFLNGKIHPDSQALATFDQCLGCRSCELSCPLSVSYQQIRNTVQELRLALQPKLPKTTSSVYKKWVKLACRIGSIAWRIYGLWWLAFQHPLLKTSKGRFKKKFAQSSPLKTLNLAIGCLQDVFHHDLIEQTVLFISRLGYQARIDQRQPCCGAIMERCSQAGSEAAGLESLRQKALRHQQKNIKRFKEWLPEDCYFLSASCQCFANRQPQNARESLYAWILQELISQKVRLSLPEPCLAYYQPYCGQAEKGEDDPVWQLMSRIEGLTMRSIPFPSSCCGGYGGESIWHPHQAKEWASPKLKALPKKAVLLVTSPDCWNQCVTWRQPDNDLTILYPTQLLFQANLTFS